MLESIRGAGINDRDIECIQFKRLSDDARDVHITFSSAAVCALFCRPESLRVKEKSYLYSVVVSAYHPRGCF